MGNQAQLENVTKLLATSLQVTPSEREEWLSLLPFMNDKQLLELVDILQSPVQAPQSSDPVPKPLQAPAKPEQPIAIVNTPVSDSSNSIATVLKRSMDTRQAEAEKPKLVEQLNTSSFVPKPPQDDKMQDQSLPKSANETKHAEVVNTSVGQSDDGQVAKSVPELASVPEEVIPELKSLEDAGRLNVTTLRGRGAVTIEAELTTLCRKFGYFSVLFALEQSPLYKTYLNSGNIALQDHISFEQAETKLSTSGQPYLTKPEFEEVNDLLQRLKHI